MDRRRAGEPAARVAPPPVGLTCYVVSGVSKIPLGEVFRGIAPFIAMDIIVLALMLFIPQIVLFLPNLML